MTQYSPLISASGVLAARTRITPASVSVVATGST